MKRVQSNRPLKKLGQNFLTNPHFQNKIVDALQINDNDTVLEIGPGKGALTAIIVNKNPKKFIAFELDFRWAAQLKETYPQVIIEQIDFLKVHLSQYISGNDANIKVIGNVPYNITSPILFKLLDEFKNLDSAVLMTQKEVAKRITAAPGNKDYGILSVLSQTFAKAEYLFEVKNGNFFPVPRVDSAVFRLTFLNSVENLNDVKTFRKLVRHVFNYRRKMLRNSLSSILEKEIVYSLETIDINLRPENLSVDDFKALTNEIISKTGVSYGSD
jgi:16S rRNA (adenine1518-N6/adenine1519-N6)-dimethyltransferase